MPYDDARPQEARDPRDVLALRWNGEPKAEVRPRERDPDQRNPDQRNPGQRDPGQRDPTPRDPGRKDGDKQEGGREPRRQEQEGGDKSEDDKSDDGKSGERGGGDKKGDAGKKPRSPLPWIILGAVILVAAIGGVAWWWTGKDLEGTDDAYTDGRVISIAPKVSGYVTVLAVTDNERVHAGQLIVQIDPRDFIASRDQARGALEVARAQLQGSKLGAEVAQKNFPARLAQAQAQLQQAHAQLFNAQTEYNRQHGVARAATTQQAIDQSTANLRTAQANVASAEAAVQQATPVQQNIGQSEKQVSQVQGQVDQAQAQLDQAELNLGYAHLVAPQEGWVTRRNVERGTYVAAGTSIMSLVSPDVWVTANFKETQLNRMRAGQQVDISVDAYPGLKLKGHLDSIQFGSGARFSAFPAENATGNFVKIVRRVPVKIDIDSGLDPAIPLPVGISVTPSVHLK